VVGALAAAELWTRVDIVAGMLLAAVTTVLAALAMIALHRHPTVEAMA
jgi:hypothetical protein